MQRNLKIRLSYEGSQYHGWQIQPHLSTVQGHLVDAIKRITSEEVLPQGSGRTDAGVHAMGQVASFQTESAIPPENLVKALNAVLPYTIRVLEVSEVTPDFHARRSAKAKTYEYRLYRGTIRPPFLVNYVCHYPYPMNEEKLKAAAAVVLGEHDFTSFAAVDPDRVQKMAALPVNHCERPNNIRTIYSSTWERLDDELVYTVRGSGFLHHMVRNLVGTFLMVGKGSLTVDDVQRILDARNRSHAGATAPASGLYLVSVEY